jgi:O-antigen/teichoic acid export membrane protein
VTPTPTAAASDVVVLARPRRRLSVTTANVLANFAGRLWTTALSILLVPLYVRFLGLETYGLVGFFTTIQVLMNVLDFGVSATIGRETARSAARPDAAQDLRDLVRTIELAYWAVGLAIGIGLFALAPVLATDWLSAQQLDPVTIRHAIELMAVVAFVQWPITFYSGGLTGLQRQVLLSAVNAGAATVRAVGAIALLWIRPSILLFFGWMACAGALQTVATGVLLWRALPRGSRAPAIRVETVRAVWRFAAGMGTTSILVLVLGQVDKFILSTMLPLSVFAAYVIGSALASPPMLAAAPVSDAMFPRYAQLAAANRTEELTSAFHRGCQTIAVLAFPVAATLMVFAPETIVLWTRKPALAASIGTTTTLLVLGSALAVFVATLDGLQVAYGWLKPALVSRVMSLIVLPPLIVILTRGYGPAGAAAAWVIVWALYLCVTPHFVYGRLLVSAKWRWYTRDMGAPFLVSLVVVIAIRAATAFPHGAVAQLLYLGAVWATALLAATIVSPDVRAVVAAQAARLR